MSTSRVCNIGQILNRLHFIAMSGLDKSDGPTYGTCHLLGRTTDQWAEIRPRTTAFFQSGKVS